jgi:hypothetical protein
MTLTLVLLAALAQPAPPTVPGALAPEPAVAVIDGEGNLRITQVSTPVYGNGPAPATRVVTWTEKRGNDTVQVTAKAKITSVVLTTTEMPAKVVEAYTSDGKPIAKEKLAELLAKERTVLVATDGKKVDPFYLEVYKEGAIVLVPPANALAAGYGGCDSPNGLPPVGPKGPDTPMAPKDKDGQPHN